MIKKIRFQIFFRKFDESRDFSPKFRLRPKNGVLKHRNLEIGEHSSFFQLLNKNIFNLENSVYY